jgi:hypothetical protein
MGQNQVSYIERGVLYSEGPFSEISLHIAWTHFYAFMAKTLFVDC